MNNIAIHSANRSGDDHADLAAQRLSGMMRNDELAYLLAIGTDSVAQVEIASCESLGVPVRTDLKTADANQSAGLLYIVREATTAVRYWGTMLTTDFSLRLDAIVGSVNAGAVVEHPNITTP